jgi:lipopolysaccharide assembly protein A
MNFDILDLLIGPSNSLNSGAHDTAVRHGPAASRAGLQAAAGSASCVAPRIRRAQNARLPAVDVSRFSLRRRRDHRSLETARVEENMQTHWIHRAVTIFFAVLTLVFALQNLEPVTMSLFQFSVRAPLAALAIIVYILGATTGSGLFAVFWRSAKSMRTPR